MLILTRKLGEVICIGNRTRVKILAIKGYQVRIGIEAPLEISVHREEVFKRIKQESANEERRSKSREEEVGNRDRSDEGLRSKQVRKDDDHR